MSCNDDEEFVDPISTNFLSPRIDCWLLREVVIDRFRNYSSRWPAGAFHEPGP